jgi:SEC-C motif/Protein of unknown function (DUF2384)
MTQKLGRNDPCPCGSGKKYKQCCGQNGAPATASTDSHEGAVGRCMVWLGQHHRKALAVAIELETLELVLAVFDGDEAAADEGLAQMDPELQGQLQLNMTEWLLAEGDIAIKGQNQRVAGQLLGPRGPLLSVAQRAWVAQLAERPLRLYDVTDVVPGVGITLCDALDSEQAPIAVAERSGSRSLKPGMQIGARVMAVAGGHQLSGAIYPFSLLAGHAVLAELRQDLLHPNPHPEDDVLMMGLSIMRSWLAQHLLPAPLPTLMDSYTGELILFTTDHYEVQSWPALEGALAAQPDVSSLPDGGWNRFIDCEDGLTRSQANITRQPKGQRVAVEYKTAGLAERGRLWFEALAGDAVKFSLREVSDPKGVMANARSSPSPLNRAPSLPQGIDPAELAHAMAGMIQRSYARWADEPLPALNGQTPRQAMANATGLERVKGLLRSYEDGEVRMAAEQGRAEISYQFLWDELGLQR